MFPLSDNYIYDALPINPAFAGSHDALSATLSYRNQWEGFSDAPKNQTLSLHSPFNNDRLGLGLLVERNSIGIFNETSLIGNYAFRMNINDGKLSLGLGFGAIVHHSAWNELVAADANDQQLMNNPPTAVLPDFSIGAYYYTKKYFVGLSLPLLLSHELDESTGDYLVRNDPHGYNYFLSGGYALDINSRVKILPSLLIKYHPDNPLQIDYNTHVILDDKIWMGLGYRNKNSLVAMMRMQLNYQIRLGFSYNFDFGGMQKYKNGTHEIVLNYVFRYSRKIIGPRHF